MQGIDVMEEYVGLREVRDKEKLMALLASKAHNGDIAINPATTAWCSAMINFAERSVGHPGNGKLNARSFLTYGNPVKLEDAEKGDICVFARGNNGWEGHVTYFVSHTQDPEVIKCLGGNQGNTGEISIENQDVHKLLGIRRY